MDSERLNQKFNGHKVKEWLKDTFRTQGFLVSQLGRSQSYVAQMLGGRVPDVETLAKVAHLIGCEMEDLLIPNEATEKAS